MEVLDCRVVRDKIFSIVKKELNNIDKKLGIAVISIGNNDVNSVYLRQKRNVFNELGIEFKEYILDSDIEEIEVLKIIDSLNFDDNIDGIMIEFPIVGDNIDGKRLINRIDYRKDVDGLTDINRFKLSRNEDCIVSSTVVGILEIFKYYDIELESKDIVIVGNGYLVGKPLSMVFRNNNFNVVVCDSKTNGIDKYINRADILVSCVGIKNLINLSNVEREIMVIDAGVSIYNGKVMGDIDRALLDNIRGSITPIIGGVGVVTTASLASNLVKCYKLSKDKL